MSINLYRYPSTATGLTRAPCPRGAGSGFPVAQRLDPRVPRPWGLASPLAPERCLPHSVAQPDGGSVDGEIFRFQPGSQCAELSRKLAARVAQPRPEAGIRDAGDRQRRARCRTVFCQIGRKKLESGRPQRPGTKRGAAGIPIPLLLLFAYRGGPCPAAMARPWLRPDAATNVRWPSSRRR